MRLDQDSKVSSRSIFAAIVVLLATLAFQNTLHLAEPPSFTASFASVPTEEFVVRLLVRLVSTVAMLVLLLKVVIWSISEVARLISEFASAARMIGKGDQERGTKRRLKFPMADGDSDKRSIGRGDS